MRAKCQKFANQRASQTRSHKICEFLKNDTLNLYEITCLEYNADTFENFEALKDFHDAIYGNKVEKVTLLNSEGIKVDKGNALSVYAPIDEKLYFLFNCKVASDKEGDYNAAFLKPEVQYILENINFK